MAIIIIIMIIIINFFSQLLLLEEGDQSLNVFHSIVVGNVYARLPLCL